MILFELSFPILTDENKLYFHSNDAVFSEGSLDIRKNSTCDFCTYFNCFSAGKYKKYTTVDNITFTLEIKGCAEIFIKNECGDVISSLAVNNTEREISHIHFSLKDADEGEIYYPEIHTKSDCTIFSGCYETDVVGREISLAAAFCTFKREEYIIPNIERLKRFKAKYSLPLQVIVSDNGSTLPTTLSDNTVHIVHNPNCGGSGGFARGLLEAADMDCTHVIFLDDDIILDTNVVLKTYSCLKILREEYFDSFIGGAMLLSEKKYLQHECGALWDGFFVSPLGHNLDMREKTNIFANDKLPAPDYQAWWYCCFPVSFGEKYGYPLPFFIKSDDVEYSVRCKCPIITMNGIGVWHDSFENKYVGYFEYYIKRNELINTALHNKKSGILMNIRKLFFCLCRLTLLQRYFLADIVVRAFDDFLKGPDQLLGVDPAEYNMELAAQAKPPTDTGIIGDAKIVEEPKSVNMLLYFLTLGGNILPSKNCCIKLNLTDIDIYKVYRARYACHMKPDGTVGYITKLRKRKLFWVVYQTSRMFFKFLFNYKRVRGEYLDKQNELMSRRFWEKYFSKYDK